MGETTAASEQESSEPPDRREEEGRAETPIAAPPAAAAAIPTDASADQQHLGDTMRKQVLQVTANAAAREQEDAAHRAALAATVLPRAATATIPPNYQRSLDEQYAQTPLPLRMSAAQDQPAATQGSETIALSGRVGARFGASAAISGLPPDWPADRAEVLGRLDEIEAAFREIAPLVQAIEASRQRAGLGHNRPPEAIEGEPLGTADLKVGITAANVFRTQLSYERPDFDVIRLCGLVLEQVGVKVAASLRWIADKRDDFARGFAQGAGILAAKAILPRLPHLLHETVAQIQHWLQVLGIPW